MDSVFYARRGAIIDPNLPVGVLYGTSSRLVRGFCTAEFRNPDRADDPARIVTAARFNDPASDGDYFRKPIPAWPELSLNGNASDFPARSCSCGSSDPVERAAHEQADTI